MSIWSKAEACVCLLKNVNMPRLILDDIASHQPLPPFINYNFDCKGGSYGGTQTRPDVLVISSTLIFDVCQFWRICYHCSSLWKTPLGRIIAPERQCIFYSIYGFSCKRTIKIMLARLISKISKCLDIKNENQQWKKNKEIFILPAVFNSYLWGTQVHLILGNCFRMAIFRICQKSTKSAAFSQYVHPLECHGYCSIILNVSNIKRLQQSP